jgi:hypothetical protein
VELGECGCVISGVWRVTARAALGSGILSIFSWFNLVGSIADAGRGSYAVAEIAENARPQIICREVGIIVCGGFNGL